MNFTFSGPHMPLGIICGRFTPARGNLEHRPLSGAVSDTSPASPISEYNPPKQTVLASLSYYIVRMMLRIQLLLLIRKVCVWRAEAIAPYIMQQPAHSALHNGNLGDFSE